MLLELKSNHVLSINDFDSYFLRTCLHIFHLSCDLTVLFAFC